MQEVQVLAVPSQVKHSEEQLVLHEVPTRRWPWVHERHSDADVHVLQGEVH